ncbi:MAG: hypothetical protein N3D74_00385 [Caldisericia bacterium]|nr:hypothetical protein [Caldisericia bacterium]
MKKFKIIFFLILLLIIIYIFLTTDIQTFLKIYYIQLLTILFIYIILNIVLKRGRYLILILFLSTIIFYFFIYPNYIEKRVLYSEIFKEESDVKLINIDLKIENGNLKILGEKINKDFIFDYSSYKKVYLFKKVLNKNINYLLIQNSIIKKDLYDSNEYNLIVNNDKNLYLTIQGKSIFYDLDFSDILLNRLNIKSNSSFLELKLPQNANNLFLNLNLKPSFIKIGLRKNFYIEIKLNVKNTKFNLKDLGFKIKNKNEYYFNGGENKVYIEINSYSSFLEFYFLD